jgi:hypothetical protein
MRFSALLERVTVCVDRLSRKIDCLVVDVQVLESEHNAHPQRSDVAQPNAVTEANRSVEKLASDLLNLPEPDFFSERGLFSGPVQVRQVVLLNS